MDRAELIGWLADVLARLDRASRALLGGVMGVR